MTGRLDLSGLSASTQALFKQDVKKYERPLRAQRSFVTPQMEWNAEVSEKVPRIPWNIFTSSVFDWRPGEHLILIGPTGQGKTTTLFGLLPFRTYVTVFATKPRDVSMEYLFDHGYTKYDNWPPTLDPSEYPRRVLWPDATDLERSEKIQREVFTHALKSIYSQGGWCVAFDELAFLSVELHMSSLLKTFYQQSRSLGISIAAATQRPVDVPVTAYSMSTHAFYLRTNDDRDLERVGELNTTQPKPFIKKVIGNLDRFQVLYANTRTGFLCRTTPPELEMKGD